MLIMRIVSQTIIDGLYKNTKWARENLPWQLLKMLVPCGHLLPCHCSIPGLRSRHFLLLLRTCFDIACTKMHITCTNANCTINMKYQNITFISVVQRVLQCKAWTVEFESLSQTESLRLFTWVYHRLHIEPSTFACITEVFGSNFWTGCTNYSFLSGFVKHCPKLDVWECSSERPESLEPGKRFWELRCYWGIDWEKQVGELCMHSKIFVCLFMLLFSWKKDL